MGGEKASVWFEYLLSYYNNRHFITEKGIDLTTNVETITKMIEEKYKVQLVNNYIDLEEVTLYPQEVFCPMNYGNKELHMTPNTHCIHHFSGSWLS